MTVGHFIADMFGGCFLPLLPLLAIHLRTDRATLGVVAAAVGIAVNLVQPLTGGILHRFHIPWLLLAGPVLAMGYALMGEVHSVPALTVLAIVAALGVGLFHPSALLGAHVASGTREHVGIPVFLSGGAFGVALGSICFTQWVAWQGFARLWWLAPPALALLLLVYLGTGVMRMDIHQPLPEHEDAPVVPMHFILVLMMGSLLAIGNTLLFTYLALHLNRSMTAGAASTLAGAALAIISLGGAVSSYLWGALSRRFGTLRITALGQIASAGTLYLLLATRQPAQVLLFAVTAGLFSGGSFFPLIATLGRRAVGFTPGLRAGLSIGGAWFIGSLGVAVAAFFIKRGMTETKVIFAIVPLALVNAAFASGLAWMQARRERTALPADHRTSSVAP